MLSTFSCGDGQRKAGPIALANFVAYTKGHFAAEERLMLNVVDSKGGGWLKQNGL